MDKKQAIKEKIISMLRKHDAKRISIFGSYVRGEADPESDIDILVDFSKRKSLFDLVDIEMELTNNLGIKADLVTGASVSPYLIDGIEKEAVTIYE